VAYTSLIGSIGRTRRPIPGPRTAEETTAIDGLRAVDGATHILLTSSSLKADLMTSRVCVVRGAMRQLSLLPVP